VSGFAAMLIGAVADFRHALPRYRERLTAATDDLGNLLAQYDVDVSFSQIYGSLEPSSIIDVVGSTLGGMVSAMVDTSLVLLLMVFILLEAAGFPRKLRAAMANPLANLDRYAQMMDEVQRYLAIKTGISIVTGGLIGVGVWILGVDFPLLWALTAFLLNYIPNVGSIIAAVPAVLVAGVQLGVGYALGTGALYVAVNTLMGNIVEPQLMGRKLGLSPLVVFLSLVFWGWVWGPVGMLLSVPLTMIVKIMLEQSDDLQWLSILLGGAPPAEPAEPGPVARRENRREDEDDAPPAASVADDSAAAGE
jgi:predicted PurR-regulated permease PerM